MPNRKEEIEIKNWVEMNFVVALSSTVCPGMSYQIVHLQCLESPDVNALLTRTPELIYIYIYTYINSTHAWFSRGSKHSEYDNMMCIQRRGATTRGVRRSMIAIDLPDRE